MHAQLKKRSVQCTQTNMKTMLKTKIATVAGTDECWRPKLSWTKCAALKLSSGGLKMLSICSKGSCPGSRHLLQAPRGHLRSSAAPLLRGGCTRAHSSLLCGRFLCIWLRGWRRFKRHQDILKCHIRFTPKRRVKEWN